MLVTAANHEPSGSLLLADHAMIHFNMRSASCRYHDCFMDGNYINIVMEYCSAGDIGKLVKARLAAKQILTEDEIMFVFVQICLALQYTHAAGVLHRDLKTSNCMLLNPSTMSSSPAAASGPSAYRGIGFPLVKLGDFGVAKVRQGTLGNQDVLHA